MKRIVETTEADGLEKLMGEQVQVWCMNYIYTGKLCGVNDADICLAEPEVVYETGSFRDAGFADSQAMNIPELFIRTSAIEAYGVVK